MVEAGYSWVGEFHYLHNNPSGSAYANATEMADSVLRAAEDAGIGITLLPVLYQRSGFQTNQINRGQRRFALSLDEYFDLVYIDADHTYESVKDDIAAWFPKVKPGGWITGHDYVDGYENDPNIYGVIPAVNELVVKHDLTLSFVGKWKDWAVKKSK